MKNKLLLLLVFFCFFLTDAFLFAQNKLYLEVDGIRFDFQNTLENPKPYLQAPDTAALNFGLLSTEGAAATLRFKLKSKVKNLSLELVSEDLIDDTDKWRFDAKLKKNKRDIRLRSKKIDLDKYECFYLKLRDPSLLSTKDSLILKWPEEDLYFSFPLVVETNWKAYLPDPKKPLPLLVGEKKDFNLVFPINTEKEIPLAHGTVFTFTLNDTSIQKKIPILEDRDLPLAFKDLKDGDLLTLEIRDTIRAASFPTLKYKLEAPSYAFLSASRWEAFQAWVLSTGLLWFFLSLILLILLMIIGLFRRKKREKNVGPELQAHADLSIRDWIQEHLEDFIRPLFKGQQKNENLSYQELVYPVLAPYTQTIKQLNDLKKLENKQEQAALVAYLQSRSRHFDASHLPSWFQELIENIKGGVTSGEGDLQKQVHQLKLEKSELQKKNDYQQDQIHKLEHGVEETQNLFVDFKKKIKELENQIQEEQIEKENLKSTLEETRASSESKATQLETGPALAKLLEEFLVIEPEMELEALLNLTREQLLQNQELSSELESLKQKTTGLIQSLNTPKATPSPPIAIEPNPPKTEFGKFVSDFEIFMQRLILELNALKHVETTSPFINDKIADLVGNGAQNRGLPYLKKFASYKSDTDFKLKYDEIVFDTEYKGIGAAYRSVIDPKKFFERVVNLLMGDLVDRSFQLLTYFKFLEQNPNATEKAWHTEETSNLIKQICSMIRTAYKDLFEIEIIELDLLSSNYDEKEVEFLKESHPNPVFLDHIDFPIEKKNATLIKDIVRFALVDLKEKKLIQKAKIQSIEAAKKEGEQVS